MQQRRHLSIRDRLDRFGLVLSGLCAVHCVLSIVLVSLLGIGGGVLGTPAIHEIGLGLAVVVGALTLGIGALHHRHAGPLAIGALGLGLMALAIVAGHGLPEALLTIAGVALVALSHIGNARARIQRPAEVAHPDLAPRELA